MVIDCTGDGDICAWAGAAYECGDAESGILQPGTVRYYFQAAQVGKVRDEKTLSAFYETGELLEEDTNAAPHQDAAVSKRKQCESYLRFLTGPTVKVRCGPTLKVGDPFTA